VRAFVVNRVLFPLTTMLLATRSSTVTLIEAFILPQVAVITAFPFPLAVTCPLAFTIAMASLSELQVTTQRS
jgi:hypothetical protein